MWSMWHPPSSIPCLCTLYFSRGPATCAQAGILLPGLSHISHTPSIPSSTPDKSGPSPILPHRNPGLKTTALFYCREPATLPSPAGSLSPKTVLHPVVIHSHNPPGNGIKRHSHLTHRTHTLARGARPQGHTPTSQYCTTVSTTILNIVGDTGSPCVTSCVAVRSHPFHPPVLGVIH